MHNDKHFRKLVQKALQDDHFAENDKLCDWDWLLYRVRMGGNYIRFLGHLHCIFHTVDSISKEDFFKFEEKLLKQTNEDYDSQQDYKNSLKHDH